MTVSFGVSGLGPGSRAEGLPPLWGQAPSSRKVKSRAWCPAGRQGRISMVTRHTLDFCCTGLGEGGRSHWAREPWTTLPGASIVSPRRPSPSPSRTESWATWFPKSNPEGSPSPFRPSHPSSLAVRSLTTHFHLTPQSLPPTVRRTGASPPSAQPRGLWPQLWMPVPAHFEAEGGHPAADVRVRGGLQEEGRALTGPQPSASSSSDPQLPAPRTPARWPRAAHGGRGGYSQRTPPPPPPGQLAHAARLLGQAAADGTDRQALRRGARTPCARTRPVARTCRSSCSDARSSRAGGGGRRPEQSAHSSARGPVVPWRPTHPCARRTSPLRGSPWGPGPGTFHQSRRCAWGRRPSLRAAGWVSPPRPHNPRTSACALSASP